MKAYRCNSCSKIHLEAGNVILHFASPPHLKTYLEYLESIDVAHYAELNGRKGLQRVIVLPVEGSPLNMAFTVQEFEALKGAIRYFLSSEEHRIMFKTNGMLQVMSLN